MEGGEDGPCMVCYRQIITYILHGVCKCCGEVALIGLYSYVDLYKGNHVLVLQENKSEGYTVNVQCLIFIFGNAMICGTIPTVYTP